MYICYVIFVILKQLLNKFDIRKFDSLFKKLVKEPVVKPKYCLFNNI